ncbi:hypothetical protein AVEN_266015-1 [Araneus ventricosus]|uniref:Uncharacterized protein n=1 Tax=Araneus ventricosus TaxID=182803 RepID=A0A4Y2SG61_ARAVE|nr:hypothetical protein AVEN_266015-1 [Araneus ventricosus]
MPRLRSPKGPKTRTKAFTAIMGAPFERMALDILDLFLQRQRHRYVLVLMTILPNGQRQSFQTVIPRLWLKKNLFEHGFRGMAYS